MGKAMAHMAVVFAELEHDFIRMRTYPRRLQVKKESGVMLSKPRSMPDKRAVVLPVSNVLGLEGSTRKGSRDGRGPG